MGNRKGPGRISSTADDLLKWDRALYSSQLVSQQTLKEAFTVGKLNDGSSTEYGFAWVIKQNPKLGKVVWHDGDNPGYKTEIVRFIDADKTIIFLSNNAYEKRDDLIKSMETILEK